jgi:hypothetical protein
MTLKKSYYCHNIGPLLHVYLVSGFVLGQRMVSGWAVDGTGWAVDWLRVLGRKWMDYRKRVWVGSGWAVGKHWVVGRQWMGCR